MGDPLSPADDDEYELEAPDDTIDKLARERHEKQLKLAGESLEIDRAQLAMEERQMLDSDGDFQFKFRFQVKHMLMATTVVAIALSLKDLLNADGVAILMVLIMLGLAGAHFYLSWEERKRMEEASARRSAAVKRLRDRQAALELDEEPTMYDQPLEDLEPSEDEPPEENRFRLSFTTKDLLIAITVAAVVMGLGVALGTQGLALVLGLVAVAGLIAYCVGAPMPPRVVTAWWVTLLLYILLSLARAVGTA